MKKKGRNPEGYPEHLLTNKDPIDSLLYQWGERVKASSEYRNQPVRIRREDLYREVTRPLRIWRRLFQVGLVTTLVFMVFLFGYFRKDTPSGSDSRMADFVTRPSPTLSITYPDSYSRAPVEKDMRERLLMILRSLQQPHKACPGEPGKLDFRREQRAIRSLVRVYYLNDPGESSPLVTIIRRLSVAVEPCMSVEEVRSLATWVEKIPQQIFLTETP